MIPLMTEHDTAPPGSAKKGKGRAFERKADPQPDDEMTIHVRRSTRDLVEEQRDRLDPPRDSLGRTRRQGGLDAFAEVLVLKGLEWARQLPDWQDPMALGGADPK